MGISVPPKGDALKRAGAYFGPLAPSAQDLPDLTIRVEEGSYYTNEGVHMEYAGGNSPAISVPSTAAAWRVVVLNESGTLQIVNGTSASSPTLPSLPDNVLPLAAVFLNAGAASITNDAVFDIRPLWEVRSETIANLQMELDDRYTKNETDNLLDNKADEDGTKLTTWKLNKDLVGAPGTDNFIEVERGASPNVSIRWNEALDQWEFTNDGSSYNAFAATVGSFYTQAQLDGGQLDNRYYTEAESDATFAMITHTHVAADVTDFTAEVNNLIGLANLAPASHLHVEADITDLDKYDTVAGSPTVNNFVSFGAGNTLADSGFSNADFALAVHTHVAADVTDFTTAADARIAAADIQDVSNVVVTGVLDGHVLVWNSGGPYFINKALELNELADVVNTTPALNDALMYDGVTYANRQLVIADVTSLQTALDDKVNDTGDTMTGNLIVQVPGNQQIQLSSRDTGSSGLEIDRSGVPGPNAVLEWDESTDQWLAGTIGLAFPILTANNLELKDLQDVSDPLTTVSTTGDVLRYDGVEWTNDPLTDKVNVAGDTMTGALVLAASGAGAPSLTFADTTKGMYDSGAGEISFSIGGAQKVLIDSTGLTTFSGFAQGSAPGTIALWNAADPTTGVVFPSPGVMDVIVGGTPVATFGGAPGPMSALVAGDIGVTVQAWDSDLDDLAALAHGGDEMVYSAAGTWATVTSSAFGRSLLSEADAMSTRTTLDLYSVTQLDGAAGSAGAKINKVASATAGNVATMTAGGEVQDGGTLLSDLALDAAVVHNTGTEVIGGDKTFSNNLIITGDLTVNGTTTTVNTADLLVSDNEIVMNADETGSPSQDCRLVVERGTDTNAAVKWNEATDAWEVGLVGSEVAISLTGHVHDAADVTTGMFADARISVSSVTQHEAALTITESQISDLSHTTDASLLVAGVLADARVQASNVTQHEAALTITESQISDLQTYALASAVYTKLESDGTAGSAGAKTDKVSGATTGNFAGLDATGNLTDSGSAAADFALASHVHDAGDVTTGMFADARVSASSVTQHQASLSITESQISDLGTTVLLGSDIGSAVQAWDADLDTFAGLSTDGFAKRVAAAWTSVASLDTSDVGSGTFADARIASSNVTQHVGDIDHDSLLNYLAAEHIDWAVTGAEDIHVDRIIAAAVTQHEAALTITESQISDLAHVDAYTKSESDGTAGSAGAKIDKVSGAAAGDVATMTAAGEVASSGTQLSALAPVASPTFTGIPVLPTYTLGTLPGNAAGGLIYVSDANSSAGAIAYNDGATWKDVGTNIAVA